MNEGILTAPPISPVGGPTCQPCGRPRLSALRAAAPQSGVGLPLRRVGWGCRSAERGGAAPLTLVGAPTFSGRAGAHPEGRATGAETGTLPDSVLVEEARRDPQAFGALYDRYCRPIYAYLASRTGDPAVAEDLTSQTFMQALQALPRYEERGLPFSGWLYRIAANVLVSHLRRHRAHETLDGAPEPHQQGAEPDVAFLRQERSLRVRAALEGLPPDQRRAITLRFDGDMRIKQVAAAMERSEGAVKMLLLRGLESLRRLLADEAVEGGEDAGTH